MAIAPLRAVGEGTWVSLGKLGSNNGIVETSEGTVLVDVPHKPTDAVALAAMLADRPPVAWIVHTDHHIDHTLTNGFFPGTVVAHDTTRQRLVDDMPSPEFVDQLLATLDPDGRELMAGHPERVPTVVFFDRVGLRPGGTSVDLLALPGHTPNTIGVHLPDVGVLFSGDAVSGMGLPSFQESSFRAWRASIDTVLALDFDTLVPGHGGVGDRQTAVRFRDQIDELVGRVDAARTAGMSIDDAAEQLRFEDRIHVTTADYEGYPPSMVEEFQRRSIRSIYRELQSAASDDPPFGSLGDDERADRPARQEGS
ncbi:MAG: MBL fold metallo-hydrolase [Actinomycetota bacterium]|jgi:cyclase|nr:MBL fold metallo-hydrolase [Actinomycetota bacterium]MDA8279361.1 MBL fold metallo-hydrolase [Actinomycetota bacterium]